MIKSVTGKYVHLEVKLRRERESLAAHILFPHKFQFHCFCIQLSPGTRILLGHKTSHSLPFLQFYLYYPNMHPMSFSSSQFSIKACFPIYCSSHSSPCIVLATSIHYSTDSYISMASVAEPHTQLEQEKLTGLSPEVYANPSTVPQSPSSHYIHSGRKRNRCQTCLDTSEEIFLTLRMKPK